MKNKLILASTSPYRKNLLLKLGVPFEIQKPLCDEDSLKKNFIGSPQNLAEWLSFKKAQSVFETLPQNTSYFVLGSDQLLHLENKIFGKPYSVSRAEDTLLLLQGKTHELITSFCILGPQGFNHTATNTTHLTMKPLNLSQIKNYIAADLPLDCAGGYKIEKTGISLFEFIQTDDFSAIEGLPLLTLGRLLTSLGFQIPSNRAATS